MASHVPEPQTAPEKTKDSPEPNDLNQLSGGDKYFLVAVVVCCALMLTCGLLNWVARLVYG